MSLAVMVLAIVAVAAAVAFILLVVDILTYDPIAEWHEWDAEFDREDDES